jgi:hypothetical protein
VLRESKVTIETLGLALVIEARIWRRRSSALERARLSPLRVRF